MLRHDVGEACDDDGLPSKMMTAAVADYEFDSGCSAADEAVEAGAGLADAAAKGKAETWMDWTEGRCGSC